MNRSAINGLVIAGALFFLLGVAGLAIPVFMTQDTKDVAKLGDIHLQTTESTAHVIPPLLSGGVLVLGLVLIGAGLYRRG
jgi:hypothetical protein